MELHLENLGKRFTTLRGSVDAVKDVTLTIAEGEFFVLLGPSGCGKSTLLNLLAGLEKPTSGTIRFGERVVAERRTFVAPRERDVAMVFQSYALYPHMSAFGNIAFPLKVAKEEKEKIERSVREIAAILKIEDFLDARPGELSGGQRQRVAMARALVRKPRLFLLDEPLSNLDAQLRAETRIELKRLQQKLGITTVYVTHDQVEAMTLGQRIAVLREGRLEQIGDADDLYRRPQSPFVARFVGAPQMNLLQVPWKREQGTVQVRLGERWLELPEDKVEALVRMEGDVCIFGLRPEHIEVRTESGEHGLHGTVEAVEPLGREQLLHVALKDIRLSALTAERDFVGGESISLRLDLSRAHLFPAENAS